jgi:hypothetical protein
MGHILQQVANVSEIPLIPMEYIGRGWRNLLETIRFFTRLQSMELSRSRSSLAEAFALHPLKWGSFPASFCEPGLYQVWLDGDATRVLNSNVRFSNETEHGFRRV